MSSRSSTSARRALSEDSLGKRPADETIYSGIKRIKRKEPRQSPDNDVTERFLIDSSKPVRGQEDRGLGGDGGESLPARPHYASRSPSPRANTTSELRSKGWYCEIDRPEGVDGKPPWRIENAICKDRSGEEELSIRRVSPHPPPASVSRPISEDQSAICGSHSNLGQLKRLSLFGSEYSISLQSEELRSAELTTPTSGPGTTSSGNSSYALSPRSRASSLMVFQLHSGEHQHSASSFTEQAQRTPLPTKKELNITRKTVGARRNIGQEAHLIRMDSSSNQAESAESPRAQFGELLLDVHLEQEGSCSRISSEPRDMESAKTSTQNNGRSYPAYRSLSDALAFGMAEKDINIHSRAPSTPVPMVLSEHGSRTPIRRRTTSEEYHNSGTRRERTELGPYTAFSSNFEVLSSESVVEGQDAVSKPTKRRGGKQWSEITVERHHSDEMASVTSNSSRSSFIDKAKQDNVTRHDVPPPRLQPIEHTLRVISQIPGSTQPFTRPQPQNQIGNAPPQLYHALPPRPSITPPPGSSHQHLQKYRPPAVIFTIDNRAESRLLTTDVQLFIEEFTKNTRVLTPPTKPSAPTDTCPIGVVMWKSLPDFYKWYSDTMGSIEIGKLKFELMDVHWQPEKSFVVPEGNLNHFRQLKQYVWDLFWVASHLNNGPLLFRVVISPFLPPGETPSSTASAWKLVNFKDPLPRLSSNIEHMLNKEEGEGLKSQVDRGSTASAGDQSSEPPAKSSQQIASSKTNRPPHPSQYIHGPPGPPVNTNRTSWDKFMLRDRAHAFLVGKNDIEVLSEESTIHDKLPYKTGTQVCGAVVDRNSGKGLVTITGKGYITQSIPTGLDETGNRYQEINIQPKQTCMIYGDAVALYYKRRTVASPLKPQPHPHQQNLDSAGAEMSSSMSSTHSIEIVVRLQMDGTSRFSTPFDKSVLRPKVTTIEFFSWFSAQTRHGGPHGPSCLKFTFKDAMPTPQSTEVSKGNEDHFNYMRKDIKTQCEKARAYIPVLKEFVVLVSVPGWVSPVGEEEEW